MVSAPTPAAALISGEMSRAFRNPGGVYLSDQFTRVRAFTMLSSYLEGNLSGVKARLPETGKEASSLAWWKGMPGATSQSRGRRRTPVSRRLSSQGVSRAFACASSRVLGNGCHKSSVLESGALCKYHVDISFRRVLAYLSLYDKLSRIPQRTSVRGIILKLAFLADVV